MCRWVARTGLMWGAGLLLWGGCAPSGDLTVSAHRAAAGYWPENSWSAIQGTLDAGFDGIEVDLVLTADHVPVLNHDAWLDGTRCVDPDEEPLPEPVRIGALDLEELESQVECGGFPAPDFPNSERIHEPLATLDQLLSALRGADPRTFVQLDLKIEPPDTPDAEDYAIAVLDRWFAADLPNPWMISSGQPEVLHAFRDYGRTLGHDVPTGLLYPHFPPGESTTAIALKAELGLALGTEDYVAQAEAAGADAVLVYWELADRQRMAAARRAGIETGLWTVNDAASLKRFSGWPVDFLITDYPGDLP